MRKVQASDAKTNLLQLLDAVERGETIVITRHGRPIARIVPDSERRQAAVREAIEGIKALRHLSQPVSAEQIRALIEEGRKH